MSKLPKPTQAEIWGLWEAGILSWMLWPQQLGIYHMLRTLPPHVLLFVMLCARQFGKSFLGVLMGVEDCIRIPNSGVLIIGPTIDQTAAIVEPRMRIIKASAPPGFVEYAKSEKKWIIAGSELYIGGFDKVAASQRGKTLQAMYVEEARDSRPDDYNRTMKGDLALTMSHAKTARMTFLTTLPEIPDHPFITDTMEKAKAQNAFASFTVHDNKALGPKGRARQIELAGGIDSDECKRDLLNIQIRSKTKTIAPDFDESQHVREFTLPDYAILQVTIDWGGVRDKTVGLVHTYDFVNNMMLFWDEFKADENTPTPTIVRGLFTLERGIKIESRSADVPGQTAVDLDQEHKYAVSLPPKTDWTSAVNAFSALWSSRPIRAMVHPRCKFLIATLRSGTFNRTRTDFDRSEFLGHMDAAAAGMYALRTQDKTSPFGRPTDEDRRALSNEVFIPQSKPEPEDLISRSIQPATFTTPGMSRGVKKFGRFGG